MHKLFEFIRSVYVVVLFVVLEIAAVSWYARSTCYTQARLLARTTAVAGDVQGLFAGIRRYFTLARENRMLVDRVARLEAQLAASADSTDAACHALWDAEPAKSRFRMMTAPVVGNTTSRAQNFLTLGRGRRDGVVEGMALLAPDGSMAGYVVDCTERYAIAMSVLNTSFRASGRLAGTDFLGSISWDALDQSEVVMGDVSKYAAPQPGQEVVSAGLSQHFPADVLIGWVESAELDETHTAYTVRVRLAAEVGRLRDVVLVENRDRAEIDALGRSEKVKQQIRPE